VEASISVFSYSLLSYKSPLDALGTMFCPRQVMLFLELFQGNLGVMARVPIQSGWALTGTALSKSSPVPGLQALNAPKYSPIVGVNKE
jgi:hypothetical protein